MSQTHKASDRESTYKTPRWVKVFGIIAIALILLVVVVVVTGLGGEHGPSRHILSGGAAGDTPSANLTDALTPPSEHSAQQP